MKRIFRKNTVLLVLIALSMVGVSACGGGKKSQRSTISGSTQGYAEAEKVNELQLQFLESGLNLDMREELNVDELSDEEATRLAAELKQYIQLSETVIAVAEDGNHPLNAHLPIYAARKEIAEEYLAQLEARGLNAEDVAEHQEAVQSELEEIIPVVSADEVSVEEPLQTVAHPNADTSSPQVVAAAPIDDRVRPTSVPARKPNRTQRAEVPAVTPAPISSPSQPPVVRVVDRREQLQNQMEDLCWSYHSGNTLFICKAFLAMEDHDASVGSLTYVRGRLLDMSSPQRLSLWNDVQKWLSAYRELKDQEAMFGGSWISERQAEDNMANYHRAMVLRGVLNDLEGRRIALD